MPYIFKQFLFEMMKYWWNLSYHLANDDVIGRSCFFTDKRQLDENGESVQEGKIFGVWLTWMF